MEYYDDTPKKVPQCSVIRTRARTYAKALYLPSGFTLFLHDLAIFYNVHMWQVNREVQRSNAWLYVSDIYRALHRGYEIMLNDRPVYHQIPLNASLTCVNNSSNGVSMRYAMNRMFRDTLEYHLPCDDPFTLSWYDPIPSLEQPVPLAIPEQRIEPLVTQCVKKEESESLTLPTPISSEFHLFPEQPPYSFTITSTSSDGQ